MERIIKDANLWSVRHELVNCTDSFQVSSVMNGCKVAKLFDTFLYLLCKDNAFIKLVASLHDAMSYGFDVIEALNCSEFGVKQAVKY